MLKSEFIKHLYNVIPQELQEDWDNSGIQIDLEDKEIKRVLVALEITGEVIYEAADTGSDMIITHHPLIFGGLDSIDLKDPAGRYITELIRLGISVWSAHTNFDKMKGGNNDHLADVLGLKDIQPMDDAGLTRQGVIEPVTLGTLAERMDFPVRYTGDPERTITKVGLCCGAGAGYIGLAHEKGMDLFVTGDVKYHDARLAESLGISVMDMGHYGSERGFPEAFISMMEDVDIEFIESRVLVSPFKLNK